MNRLTSPATSRRFLPLTFAHCMQRLCIVLGDVADEGVFVLVVVHVGVENRKVDVVAHARTLTRPVAATETHHLLVAEARHLSGSPSLGRYP